MKTHVHLYDEAFFLGSSKAGVKKVKDAEPSFKPVSQALYDKAVVGKTLNIGGTNMLVLAKRMANTVPTLQMKPVSDKTTDAEDLKALKAQLADLREQLQDAIGYGYAATAGNLRRDIKELEEKIKKAKQAP